MLLMLLWIRDVIFAELLTTTLQLGTVLPMYFSSVQLQKISCDTFVVFLNHIWILKLKFSKIFIGMDTVTGFWIADNMHYVLIMDCFRFILWSFKKRRKIPNWLTFERELFFLIETTASRNIGLKNGILNTNLIANFLRVRG